MAQPNTGSGSRNDSFLIAASRNSIPEPNKVRQNAIAVGPTCSKLIALTNMAAKLMHTAPSVIVKEARELFVPIDEICSILLPAIGCRYHERNQAPGQNKRGAAIAEKGQG